MLIAFAAGPVAWAAPATATQHELLAKAIAATAGSPEGWAMAADAVHHAANGTLNTKLASAFLDAFGALGKVPAPSPAALALAA